MRDITVGAVFASSHKDESEGPHLHGHTFYVTATERNPGDASLRRDLSGVVEELHLRSLDEMLVAGGQDFHSIAAWIMERLALRHPRLTSVVISVADDPDAKYGVQREVTR